MPKKRIGFLPVAIIGTAAIIALAFFVLPLITGQPVVPAQKTTRLDADFFGASGNLVGTTRPGFFALYRVNEFSNVDEIKFVGTVCVEEDAEVVRLDTQTVVFGGGNRITFTANDVSNEIASAFGGPNPMRGGECVVFETKRFEVANVSVRVTPKFTVVADGVRGDFVELELDIVEQPVGFASVVTS